MKALPKRGLIIEIQWGEDGEQTTFFGLSIPSFLPNLALISNLLYPPLMFGMVWSVTVGIEYLGGKMGAFLMLSIIIKLGFADISLSLKPNAGPHFVIEG